MQEETSGADVLSGGEAAGTSANGAIHLHDSSGAEMTSSNPPKSKKNMLGKVAQQGFKNISKATSMLELVGDNPEMGLDGLQTGLDGLDCLQTGLDGLDCLQTGLDGLDGLDSLEGIGVLKHAIKKVPFKKVYKFIRQKVTRSGSSLQTESQPNLSLATPEMHPNSKVIQTAIVLCFLQKHILSQTY